MRLRPRFPLVLPSAMTLSRRSMLFHGTRAGVLVTVATFAPHRVHAEAPVGGSSSAMAAIAEAWTAAWNAHDSAQIAALFTPDGVYEDLAFDLIANGTEEITRFADGFFAAAPDLHIDLLAGFGTDEWAAAEWLFSGTDTGGITGKPTSNHFAVRGATIFTLQDGKATRNTDYYNASTVLEQLGLLPATAAATPPA